MSAAIRSISDPTRWRVIVKEEAERHGITVQMLIGNSRERYVLAARYAAIWRMRNELQFSSTKIGELLGGRDHSTIINAISSYEKYRADPTKWKQHYARKPVTGPLPAAWSQREDDVLKYGCTMGRTYVEISRMLAAIGSNRSSGSCRHRRAFLSLAKEKVKREVVLPEPKEVRQTATVMHKPYYEFAAACLRESGGQTVADLKAKVRGQELDIPARSVYRWQPALAERSYIGSQFGHVVD
jgi:hypothetical protein